MKEKPSRWMILSAAMGLLVVVEMLLLTRMWMNQEQFFAEQRRLETRVAEIEVQVADLPRGGRGHHSRFAANGSSLPGRNAEASPSTRPQAEVLARIVILELNKDQAMSPAQAQTVKRILAGYGKGSQDEASTTRLRAEVDGALSDAQRAFIAAHQDQVDSKTDELNRILSRDQGSLVDVMADFLDARGAK
jgi:hypothetical protein